MTNNINGIDVSECPCKDDDKCLEVPILNEYGDLIDYQDCEPQTLCPYRSKTKIQRLQEENEGLKSLNDFNVQKIEVLQEENEKLKARLKTLDDEVLTIEITPDEFERYKKYEQALEEMRKEANRLLFVENPIYGYNNSNYFEILAKYVLAKTKEVLDDRN